MKKLVLSLTCVAALAGCKGETSSNKNTNQSNSVFVQNKSVQQVKFTPEETLAEQLEQLHQQKMGKMAVVEAEYRMQAMLLRTQHEAATQSAAP